jgi:hypothetical protein
VMCPTSRSGSEHGRQTRRLVKTQRCWAAVGSQYRQQREQQRARATKPGGRVTAQRCWTAAGSQQNKREGGNHIIRLTRFAC